REKMGLKSKFKRFFDLEDDYEYEEETPPVQEVYLQSAKKEPLNRANIVSLQSVQQTTKVILHEPRTYDEAQQIADQYKSRKAVIINLQRMSNEQAKRIVDFLSG